MSWISRGTQPWQPLPVQGSTNGPVKAEDCSSLLESTASICHRKDRKHLHVLKVRMKAECECIQTGSFLPCAPGIERAEVAIGPS